MCVCVCVCERERERERERKREREMHQGFEPHFINTALPLTDNCFQGQLYIETRLKKTWGRVTGDLLCQAEPCL